MIEELFENLEDYENAIKLQEAQSYLRQTDYITNKIVEYQVLGKELEQDYTETLLKREEAREIIRELEAEVKDDIGNNNKMDNTINL